ADQWEQDGGYEPDMDAEGPAQRRRPHGIGATPERTEEGADEGRVDGNVGHHHGGPIGGLVPGKKGAGDRHRQHQNEQADAFGAIVRGIHLWSAYILLFVIGLHMVRTFFSGSYKRPRELNWVTGVGLFVLVLGMAITGAFLPWDQAAYWTAVVVTNIPAYTPFIGSFIRALWRGGDFVGPITLSRTFGIHVWLIPAILFPLIGAHLALLRKHGEFGSYIN